MAMYLPVVNNNKIKIKKSQIIMVILCLAQWPFVFYKRPTGPKVLALERKKKQKICQSHHYLCIVII